MGTRADCYVGRGAEAEWLGSFAWDGYPKALPRILRAKSEKAFRAAVAARLSEEDGTLPDDGWPWPWDDSRTTDFAYAFDDGKVWISCFGREWYLDPNAEDSEGEETAIFPDMSQRRVLATPGSKRSGLLVFKG